MKHHLLTLCALVSYNLCLAQEHTILTYINTGFSTENSIYSAYGNKTTIFSASPGIGFAFTPAIAAGLQGSYDQYKTAAGLATENDFIIHDWTAGIFARYTWYSKSFVFVYAQADISYAGGNAAEKGLGMQGSYSGMQASLYPVVGARLKSIAFTFSFGGVCYYNHNWGDNTAGIKNYNSTQLTLGRQFQVGILKPFPLKQKSKVSTAQQ